MLRDLQAEDFYRHLKGERCSVHSADFQVQPLVSLTEKRKHRGHPILRQFLDSEFRGALWD